MQSVHIISQQSMKKLAGKQFGSVCSKQITSNNNLHLQFICKQRKLYIPHRFVWLFLFTIFNIKGVRSFLQMARRGLKTYQRQKLTSIYLFTKRIILPSQRTHLNVGSCKSETPLDSHVYSFHIVIPHLYKHRAHDWKISLINCLIDGADNT